MHTDPSAVRVRFAPSPTGPLHIGGVRTALYNYLFAKQHGGTFILRIEDTDQTRYTEGAEAYIAQTLAWCGLTPDESIEQGGPYGPYKQSERKDLYQQYAQQLLDAGKAYYAFDTPEELEAMRERAKAEGKVAKYGIDTRAEMCNALTLPAEEVKARLESGAPYVVRLKVEAGETIIFDDLVRGQVRYPSEEVDDKVLLKSDGLPTYHLANIVDDHLMEITHVIRGEEWLPSTPLHVLLYRYLGWEATMPQFAHLPLILKPAPESYINKQTLDPLAVKLTDEFCRKTDGITPEYRDTALAFVKQTFQDKANIAAKLKEGKKDDDAKRALKAFLKTNLFGKLSKRDGDRLGFPVFPLDWHDINTGESAAGFRERGFLPEALINFLAFLGWNPGTEQELFSLEELVAAFDLSRVNKAGARFSFDKAQWFNQQYILKMTDEELAAHVRPQVTDHGHPIDEARLVRICGLVKERIPSLDAFWGAAQYFFQPVLAFDEKTVQKKWKPEDRPQMEALAAAIQATPDFAAASLEQLTKAFIHDQDLKMGNVLPIIRISLTGTMQGPSVFEVAELLGREEVAARFERAFAVFDEKVGA